jgi:hypothetical protein
MTDENNFGKQRLSSLTFSLVRGQYDVHQNLLAKVALSATLVPLNFTHISIGNPLSGGNCDGKVE